MKTKTEMLAEAVNCCFETKTYATLQDLATDMMMYWSAYEAGGLTDAEPDIDAVRAYIAELDKHGKIAEDEFGWSFNLT